MELFLQILDLSMLIAVILVSALLVYAMNTYKPKKAGTLLIGSLSLVLLGFKEPISSMYSNIGEPWQVQAVLWVQALLASIVASAAIASYLLSQAKAREINSTSTGQLKSYHGK